MRLSIKTGLFLARNRKQRPGKKGLKDTERNIEKGGKCVSEGAGSVVCGVTKLTVGPGKVDE